MGNEINKSEISSSIEDERIIFPGFSSNLSENEDKEDKSNEKKKVIDKEHTTISKIFKAKLEEEGNDNFTYLDEYLGILLSLGKEPKFRINDLDEIIHQLIKDKENPLKYLFVTYHRSIVMIEIKYRKEYDKTYKQIHRILANYISIILTDPSILNINISEEEKYENFKQYLTECNMDELGFILYDIGLGNGSDEKALKTVFGFFFRYINEYNRENFKSFIKSDYKKSLVKNMIILKSLFKAFPQIIKIYVDISLQIKNNFFYNGKIFQKENYICKYIDVSPFEGNLTEMRSVLNINMPKRETDSVINNYTNKLNEYLSEVAEFFIVMFIKDPFNSILDWAYELIKLNLDKLKLYNNNQNSSSNGFLLNIIIILNKIIFKEYEKGTQNEETYSDFIFKIVGKIDALFTLTEDKIPFSKFDRANPEIVKEIIKDEGLIPPEFNIYTKLFFIQEIIISITLKSFMDIVDMFSKTFHEIISLKGGKFRIDIETQNMLTIELFFRIYLSNKEFNKYLLRFSEISAFLIFSLNNKKYSQDKFSKYNKDISYKKFLDDFYYHINFNDNFAISFLPQFIYQNLITISQFVKRFNEDSLIDNLYCTKALVYFSLIFSCQKNLILNPHFRMEIFDIMIFFFVSDNAKDKNKKINKIFELLDEKFIKDTLMESIMRVFVDVEILYYDKLIVRYKILLLIENINKGYGHLFEENIRAYTEKYPEDSKAMVNNFISDLSKLNGDSIEHLKAIKKYQDLISDKELYNSLNEAQKKDEENKFRENDRFVRSELNLLNVSLKFLIILSKNLQNFFIQNNLIRPLISFLNYALDYYASPLGNELKLKNFKEYNFNPRFILGALLTVYGSFYEKEEFIKTVVQQEGSYKYINFARAKYLVTYTSKIEIDNIDSDNYLLFVSKLKETERKVKEENIDYDDAPEEFIDQITSDLMSDPVKLPQSNMIVDRSSIETHLFSSPTDPFTRTPLTKDMLIPCPELKARIEEYKSKKEEEKKKQKEIEKKD